MFTHDNRTMNWRQLLNSSAFTWCHDSTGYNRRGLTGDMTQGRWSDSGSTVADVGVWGYQQPDIGAGDCSYMTRGSGSTWTWYLGNCDLDLPFVCQATPCTDSECLYIMCLPSPRHDMMHRCQKCPSDTEMYAGIHGEWGELECVRGSAGTGCPMVIGPVGTCNYASCCQSMEN